MQVYCKSGTEVGSTVHSLQLKLLPNEFYIILGYLQLGVGMEVVGTIIVIGSFGIDKV